MYSSRRRRRRVIIYSVSVIILLRLGGRRVLCLSRRSNNRRVYLNGIVNLISTPRPRDVHIIYINIIIRVRRTRGVALLHVRSCIISHYYYYYY